LLSTHTATAHTYPLSLHDALPIYLRSDADQLLLPARANLRVRGTDKQVYETLVQLIDRLAGNDPYILATPDCPEVYFLSRRKNPTRVLYEFFDPVQPTPRQLLEQLTAKGVRVVVLNTRPEFSQPVSHELYATLTRVYSRSADVGWFRVLWRACPPRSRDPLTDSSAGRARPSRSRAGTPAARACGRDTRPAPGMAPAGCRPLRGR